MTIRALALTASIVVTCAGSARAQPPPPATAGRATPPRTEQPTPAAAPRAAPLPRREGQPVNIKVDFTLTDQLNGGPAVKRTVSVVVADGRTGQIRSQSDVVGVNGGVPLNIDTAPELLTDGKIRLGFTLQYDWPAPLEQTDRNPLPRGTLMKTAMHDSATLIVESGKTMTAAQSADPIGDRQVTVEVKATILR